MHYWTSTRNHKMAKEAVHVYGATVQLVLNIMGIGFHERQTYADTAARRVSQRAGRNPSYDRVSMMTATGTGVRSFVWLVSLFPTSLLKQRWRTPRCRDQDDRPLSDRSAAPPPPDGRVFMSGSIAPRCAPEAPRSGRRTASRVGRRADSRGGWRRGRCARKRCQDRLRSRSHAATR